MFLTILYYRGMTNIPKSHIILKLTQLLENSRLIVEPNKYLSFYMNKNPEEPIEKELSNDDNVIIPDEVRKKHIQDFIERGIFETIEHDYPNLLED